MMFRLCIFILVCHMTLGDKIEEKMYMKIERQGFSFCFRRLNATHSIGCSSSKGGNVGTVYLMLEDNVSLNITQSDSPYVIVMKMKHFSNQSLMAKLNASSYVTGVLVIEPSSKEERPKSFSVDQKCPNADHSVYGSKTQCSRKNWNPYGNDYFFQKWNFPIALLHKSENDALKRIIECFNKHNTEKSPDDRRCSIEIKTPMNGVKNSRVCLKRNVYNGYFIGMARFCDIMKGFSFHVVHSPTLSESDKIILVTARLDSISLFTGKSFGSFAVSPAVGIVLSLAKAFSGVVAPSKKKVIFSLLNGESMEYLGSTRVVYDIKKKVFLKSVLGNSTELRNIETIIDLNQLGYGADNGKFYVHTVKSSERKQLDKRWIDLLRSNMKSETELNSIVDDILPPSSVQSFLKETKDLSIILLTDYQSQYENSHYHSMFDDVSTINQNHLYNLANSIYKSMYSEMYSAPKDESLDKMEFEKIVGCLYNISQCTIIEESLPVDISVKKLKKTSQLDMAFRIANSDFAATVKFLFFYLSGKAVKKVEKKADCKSSNDSYPRYSYQWINGPAVGNKSAGICWRSLMAQEQVAILNTEDEAWKQWNTTDFSYWTESIWDLPSLRLFLKPSKRWETIVLSSGVIVTLVSILCTVLLLKYFETLFPSASYLAGRISP